MTPTEIPALLEKYGITGLRLKSHDEEKHVYTYGYSSADLPKMVKALGSPSITSSGKVAIFTIQKVCKIGVSQDNRMVRVIDLNPDSAPAVPQSHLSVHETKKELEFGYKKAQTSKRLRLPFVTEMWHYFNQEKFQNRLPIPTLLVSDKPPGNPKGLNRARGVYYTRLNGPAGTLWLADFLFNSPMPFFNEILLHEMCHQAVACLDHVNDPSEGGHGPNWQAWMRRVGLDPRRYDPTDETVYQTSDQRGAEEEKNFALYGPLTPAAEIRRIEKLPHPSKKDMAHCEVYFVTKGRALEGVIRGRQFTFRGKHGSLNTLSWKSTPDPANFYVRS